LLEEMINAIIEGELDAHLDEDQRMLGNRKNGKGSKKLRHPPVRLRSTAHATDMVVLSQSLLRNARQSWHKIWKTRSLVFMVWV